MYLIDESMIDYEEFPTYAELNCAAITALMHDYITLSEIADTEYASNGATSKHRYLYALLALYGWHIKKRL